MKLLKIFGAFIVLLGVGLAAIVAAPSVYGQRDDRRDQRLRELTVLAGGDSAIGVTVRDVQPAEAGGERPAGVLIDGVRPDSPADKAGLRRGDIVVEFDGERVRSARQFGRLVQETPAGRTVKVALVRDGRRSDVEITAGNADRYSDVTIHGDFGGYVRDFGRELERLGDRMPPFDFNFDFDWPRGSGRRLGVTVQPLTNQLAGYFGAREGVLVTSVAPDSAASQAGLKAGDVIISINGQGVRSRQDLVRAVRDAPESGEITIGIVRDKQESTVAAKIATPPRRSTRGRPV
jgi:serine protease Do